MASYTIVEKDCEYIPEWDDNREQAEPITFTLKYLTNAERAKCYRISVNAAGEPTLDPDYDALAKYGIVKIDNFKIVSEGKERQIVTAKDFMKLPGFAELYLEVATQVFIMNARQDLKNSQ